MAADLLTVRFLNPDGSVILETDMDTHDTVMEVAVREGVSGIIAECGGSMSCGTCHVYLQPDANERFEAQEDLEADLIDGLDNKTDCSRLSCQLYPIETGGSVDVTVPSRP